MKFDTQGWGLDRGNWGGLHGILIAPRNRDPQLMVTFCHGFGAPGTDLVSLTEEIVPLLSDDLTPPAFFFPEGPIDLEETYGMPGASAWWPLNMAMLAELAAADDFSALQDQVPAGLDAARTQLVEAITSCASSKGWDSLSHVLGGFSQGSMLAVDTALRGASLNVKGVVIWSGALICESVWREAHCHRALQVPAFQSHGTQDSILPVSAGRALNQFLSDLGWTIDGMEFQGPHTIPMAGIEGAARLIEGAITQSK
ncbi:MAG: lysophospholipase [Pirellula sp.]|jgi:phospholipase/carboxylesterase|nr:lysophospholipase [Pirellula sp.]